MSNERGAPADRTGLAPAEVLGTESGERRSGHNNALWLIDLYFRPRKFFSEYIHEHLWVLTALCAWFAGIAGGLERLESRLEQGKLSGLEGSWPFFLGTLCATSIVSAILYFHLGGWWYARRLRFCGVAAPDMGLVRRVYLYAQMVFALPVLASLIHKCLNYATPIAAVHGGGGPWDIAVLLFLFWSVVTSYVGVRTAFGVRGWRPALWFCMLPLAVYSAAILALVAVAVLGLHGAQEPDVRNPSHVKRQQIEFAYPGDWWVETSDPDYDPEEYIPITMMADAMVLLRHEQSDREPAEAVSDVLDAYNLQEGDPGVRTFDRWGAMRGVGSEAEVEIEGRSYVVRVFGAGAGEDRLFLVYEVCRKDDAKTLRPGFDLIARTMKLRAP